MFVARGEIWAASARDGGDAVRVTRSYARESQIDWAPDSRRIVYVSERDAVPHVFLYDFTTSRETQLTSGATGDAAPRISPDGKSVAFVRDGKDLRVLDLAAQAERSLATGYLSRAPRGVAWSPDSRWVAYLGLSARSFRNVYAVPAAGGESRAVSALPNGNANNISWSPDGTYLLFNTSQRTEEGQVVRVDLILRTPRFREDRSATCSRRASPAKPGASAGASAGAAPDRDRDAEPARDPSKPVEIVFDDIRRRAEPPAGRRRRDRADDQPRRPVAAAHGDSGRAAEPLRLLRSTSWRASRRSRAS